MNPTIYNKVYISVKVGDAGKMGIFPEVLKVVELAYLGQEDKRKRKCNVKNKKWAKVKK